MPLPLIVLCAVVLLVVLLLSLRVRLCVRAQSAVVLDVKILFLRFRLYPKKKRIRLRDYSYRRLARIKKKEAKRAEKKDKKRHKKKSSPASDGQEAPLTLRDKIKLVRAICAVLIRRTQKHLHLHTSQLHVSVATGDPATTALAFAAVSQSVAYLLATLDEITRLKVTEPDVAVVPDFLSEHSKISADITFSIRVWGLLLTLLPAFITQMNKKRALKSARRKKQQQKLSSKKGN